MYFISLVSLSRSHGAQAERKVADLMLRATELAPKSTLASTPAMFAFYVDAYLDSAKENKLSEVERNEFFRNAIAMHQKATIPDEGTTRKLLEFVALECPRQEREKWLSRILRQEAEKFGLVSIRLASMYSALGSTYDSAAVYDSAVDAFMHASEASQTGSSASVDYLITAARISCQHGLPQAKMLLQQAEDAVSRTKDSTAKPVLLHHLALGFAHAGDRANAYRVMKESLESFDDKGSYNLLELASAEISAGSIFLGGMKYTEAQKLFEKAWDRLDNVKDKNSAPVVKLKRIVCRWNQVACSRCTRDYSKGNKYADELAKLLEQCQDKNLSFSCLEVLAAFYSESSQSSKARICAERALQVAEKLPLVPSQRALCLFIIAEAESAKGQALQARKHLEQAYACTNPCVLKTASSSGAATYFAILSKVYTNLNDASEAHKFQQLYDRSKAMEAATPGSLK